MGETGSHRVAQADLDLTVEPQLALNSQQASCLHLLRAEIELTQLGANLMPSIVADLEQAGSRRYSGVVIFCLYSNVKFCTPIPGCSEKRGSSHLTAFVV